MYDLYHMIKSRDLKFYGVSIIVRPILYLKRKVYKLDIIKYKCAIHNLYYNVQPVSLLASYDGKSTCVALLEFHKLQAKKKV